MLLNFEMNYFHIILMNHGNFNLEAFQSSQEQLQQAFNNVVTPQNDEPEMPTFSAESIIDANDDGQMQLLCNFTCAEFIEIYGHVQRPMEIAHEGGRRGYYSAETIFLITLCHLKTAMNFPALEIQFGFTSHYMDMLISSTIRICAPILEKWMIRWIPMSENVRDNSLFRFFPQCIVAVDGSVQKIPRPSIDQNSFYSGKYKCHCLKMQVAVGPKGLAVDIKGPYKGAVHDFTIFQQTDTKTKISQERNRFILSNPQSRLPPVSALFDKGYMGVNNIIRESVIPIKKPRNRNYSEEQLDYNHRVSFDRILVERWFGRHKTLWGMMFIPFPLKHSKYYQYYSICAALTNYHITHHPLTANDPIDPELVDEN